MTREEIKGVSLKPCPFCGEQLVLSSDHHGEWWAHKLEPGPCIDSTTQLHDAKDFAQWNTRPAEEQDAELLREAAEALKAEVAECICQKDGLECSRLICHKSRAVIAKLQREKV